MIHPSISPSPASSSTSIGQSGPAGTQVASSSSSENPTVSRLRKLYHPTSITLRIPRRVVDSVQLRRTVEQEELRRRQFIEATPYDRIVISGKQITRDALLQMTKGDALAFIAKLGFQKRQLRTKFELLQFIWTLESDEQFQEVADKMEGKGRRVSADRLKTALPMLDTYRNHFASIDRVDIFLSRADSEIKHRKWQSRFLERILFLGFNNVRVLLAEHSMVSRNSPYQRVSVDDFLNDLFDLFIELADEKDPILTGYNDAWND